MLGVSLVAGGLWWLGAPAVSRVGVNGRIEALRLSRYEKLCAFLARDAQYRRVARTLTGGAESGPEALERILEWTTDALGHGVPSGLAVQDDHVANIMVRGFGTDDQIADVFATLCTYAGYPTVMYYLHSGDRATGWVGAATRVGGEWILVDTWHGRVFRDAQAEFLSVTDLLEHPEAAVFSGEVSPELTLRYRELFAHLTPVGRVALTRAQLQMPGPRLLFAVGHRLGLLESPRLFYNDPRHDDPDSRTAAQRSA